MNNGRCYGGPEATKADFDAFKPARNPALKGLIVEKEWYAVKRGNVIGTLTFDQTDKDTPCSAATRRASTGESASM